MKDGREDREVQVHIFRDTDYRVDADILASKTTVTRKAYVQHGH